MVDVTIIKALEENVFKKNDFLRTDNYEIRIRPDGTRKLIDALDRTFSQRINFKGMNNQWYRILQYNARDFSQFLRGKRKKIESTHQCFYYHIVLFIKKGFVRSEVVKDKHHFYVNE